MSASRTILDRTPPSDLIIIGAGGAGLEAAMVAKAMTTGLNRARWNLLGFVDDAPGLTGAVVGGLPVLATVAESLTGFAGRNIWFHCAIGNNAVRRQLAARFDAAGYSSATLIAPTAVVAGSASVGGGSYIGPFCFIGPESKIGRHALINVHASIGHNSVTEDFAQICPGARVSGGCAVGEGAFLGSNAVLAPRVKIGAWSSLSAVSFAGRDIPADAVYVGNPARRLR